MTSSWFWFILGAVVGILFFFMVGFLTGHVHAESACALPWQSYSATQVISGDPFVAERIGPLNRDAYARLSIAEGGQAQLNGYFRGLYGVGC